MSCVSLIKTLPNHYSTSQCQLENNITICPTLTLTADGWNYSWKHDVGGQWLVSHPAYLDIAHMVQQVPPPYTVVGLEALLSCTQPASNSTIVPRPTQNVLVPGTQLVASLIVFTIVT